MAVDNFGEAFQKIALFFRDKTTKPIAVKALLNQPTTPTTPVESCSERVSQNPSPRSVVQSAMAPIITASQDSLQKLRREFSFGLGNTPQEVKRTIPEKTKVFSNLHADNSPFQITQGIKAISMNEPVEEYKSEPIINAMHEESGRSPAEDEFFGDKKSVGTSSTEKKKDSLFTMMSKKTESLVRREPLPNHNLKQKKISEVQANAQKTFIKNFEADYIENSTTSQTNAPKFVTASQTLLQAFQKQKDSQNAGGRVLLNRALIGNAFNSQQPTESSRIPTRVADQAVMEPIQELNSMRSNETGPRGLLPENEILPREMNTNVDLAAINRIMTRDLPQTSITNTETSITNTETSVTNRETPVYLNEFVAPRQSQRTPSGTVI